MRRHHLIPVGVLLSAANSVSLLVARVAASAAALVVFAALQTT